MLACSLVMFVRLLCGVVAVVVTSYVAVVRLGWRVGVLAWLAWLGLTDTCVVWRVYALP